MNNLSYEEFSRIKIESLTKFWGYSRNKATYNRIKSNGVNTLQDLFLKYDSNSLVFPEFDKDANAQARAIIELIRYSYLKADLLLDVYLNKEIRPFKLIKTKSKPFMSTFEDLRALGFEKRQASSMAHYISRNLQNTKKLGDIISTIYYKNIRISGIGINELEDLRIKLSILVEYYNSKKTIEEEQLQVPSTESNPIISDMYIKSLEEEEQILLEKRANLDKKIAIVQAKLLAVRNKEEGKRL